MIEMTFLYGAFAIIAILIMRKVIINLFGIDIQQVNATRITDIFKPFNVVSRNTGTKSLKMINAGNNKATVMATLRNITGIDKKNAKNIIERAPIVFMKGISYQEADLTKKALEYVGAKIEIK